MLKKKVQYYISYASLKRWVLIGDLKAFNLCGFRRSQGSIFHHLGAHTENALSPLFLCLDLLSLSKFMLVGRNALAGSYSSKSSFKYVGARLFIALYASKMILNLILASIGNQCKRFRRGVTLSAFFLTVNESLI